MHLPVMLDEVIGFLNLKPGYTVLDGTVGSGGHAKEMLKRILPGGRLIGLDVDAETLVSAKSALGDFSGHFKLINENFKDLDKILDAESVFKIDAILLDLGVSSYQLDEGERGFSIKRNGRLDMRMDSRINITAYDVVNRFKERDLSEIISDFGEERFHNRIARYIADERSRKPIETTFELAQVIRRAVGPRYRKSRIDPATRTFQAIRIFVNDELKALEEGLKKAILRLGPGARISVISFHSLEDRIVKNTFKDYSKTGYLKIITKKPVTPSPEEEKVNPRSRSAKLRAAERMK